MRCIPNGRKHKPSLVSVLDTGVGLLEAFPSRTVCWTVRGGVVRYFGNLGITRPCGRLGPDRRVRFGSSTDSPPPPAGLPTETRTDAAVMPFPHIVRVPSSAVKSKRFNYSHRPRHKSPPARLIGSGNRPPFHDLRRPQGTRPRSGNGRLITSGRSVRTNRRIMGKVENKRRRRPPQTDAGSPVCTCPQRVPSGRFYSAVKNRND